MRRTAGAALIAALMLVLGAPAVAGAAAPALTDQLDQWLPSPDGATWTYSWSDSQYAPQATLEQYKLTTRTGAAFELQWTTKDLGNGEGTVDSAGVMDFTRSDSGLINTGWSSTPPPSQFPILCASASGCGNSLAGSLFMTIWGTRGPVIQEPLLEGASWNAVGGASNDVSSENHYEGMQQITVPAFPAGVSAARIRSDVTQAGALGDPYGSGERTVWWVRGVGPVRVLFRHTGGAIGHVDLVGTSLAAKTTPPDVNYLPLGAGDRFTYRWRNSKHMPKWSTQQFTVAQVVNNTARVDVKSVKGPIKVAGSYVFSTRVGGVTNIAATTKAQSLSNFPPLGPKSQPASKRRHFFTPFDLMTYGFNPVLGGYPVKGDSWKAGRGTRDFTVFGVVGSSKVLGLQKVTTPAGRFNALAVESTLKQSGFPFGSGTRTSWFAPGKGLVKLTFEHRDGSVSTVERAR